MMLISEIEKPDIYSIRHFGIPGMHWGHHTKVESARVSKATKNLKDAKKKFEKNPSLESDLNFKYAKSDLSSAKILDHLSTKEKSNTQIKLESKYKDKGMNDDEAAVAAYKNIRTRKIIAAVGAVTITALAGYAAYKFHNDRVDKIIKDGTLLQRVSSDGSMSIRENFYASKNKIDSVKYQGMYGNTLKAKGDVYNKKIKTLKEIKQASPKSARDTFINLMNTDKEFRDSVGKNVEAIGDVPFSTSNYRKGYKHLSKGKIDKSVYEAFNASIPIHNSDGDVASSKFYKALYEKGYNAIQDVNDVKYSGYHAKSATILFKTKDIVNVVENKKLTDKVIGKNFLKSLGALTARSTMTLGAIYSGAILGASSITTALDNKAKSQRIGDYKKEHPDTKKSYTDIKRMIERGQA